MLAQSIADDENVHVTKPISNASKPTVGSGELRLADAIARLKRTDEEIAASTFGEVDASRVALYRAGKTPLPSWYDITGLLRQCGLTPTDIGQKSTSAS